MGFAVLGRFSAPEAAWKRQGFDRAVATADDQREGGVIARVRLTRQETDRNQDANRQGRNGERHCKR